MNMRCANLIVVCLALSVIVGCENKGSNDNAEGSRPKSASSSQRPTPSQEKEKRKKQDVKTKVEALKKQIEFIEVGIKHIKYEKFAQKNTVKFDEDIEIGDSDYVAVVVDFVPDFVMDRETKEVSSRSEKLNNPAIKIELYEGEEFLFDTWAIYNFPSYHRVRDPGLIFSFLNAKIGGKLLSDLLPQETQGPIGDLAKMRESQNQKQTKKQDVSLPSGGGGSGTTKKDGTAPPK